MNEWIDNVTVVLIFNRILLGHKKYEILPFDATWMDLEGPALSEINQTETTTI